MADGTGIEWTDATWNPIRGCTRVSEGCRNCYAEKVAARFSGPGQPYEGLARFVGHGATGREARWTGKVRVIEDQMLTPLRWQRPRRIFVNSMSDLFHEDVPDEAIDRIFAVMALASQHTFQILTKRPERMQAWFAEGRRSLIYGHLAGRGSMSAAAGGYGLPPAFVAARMDPLYKAGWPLHNVWLGVSVEHQAAADERIPLLLDTPAAVRFISAEPLLGPIDLRAIDVNGDAELDALTPSTWEEVWREWKEASLSEDALDEFLDWFNLSEMRSGPMGPVLDWVIVGGESGPGARPFDMAWSRTLVEQCRDANVACFVKQLGGHPVDSDRPGMRDTNGNLVRLIARDRKGGDWSEWPEDLRVREFPRTRAA